MTRRFVEHDHPRWPRGTGEKSGEFRDKTPNWAHRVSASLPIAGGGSVATGLEHECPVCHRNVKVVGNGKLSTHNRPKRDGGGRCPGSGQVVDPTRARPEITTRIRPPRGTRRPDNLRPPPRPPIPGGRRAQDLVGTNPAGAQMQQWRTRPATSSATHRAKQYKLEGQIVQAQNRVEALQRQVDRGDWYYTQDDLTKAEDRLAQLQRDRDVEQHLADQYAGFDPTNPLAYYGDMLHIEDDSVHSYAALVALEKYPPILHRIAAEYLGNTSDGGIWIGAKPVPELDNMRRHLAGSKPGGDWKGDPRGWAAPDGVLVAQKYMVVGYSGNTEDHRETRRRLYARPDVDASAASHEFGHLLDAAIGYAEHGRYHADASEQRLFRLIYGRVKRDAGSRLQPHFRQRGDSGPSEVWAEGVEIWGQGGSDPVAAPGFGHLTRREFAAIQKFHISAATAKDLMRYYDRLFKDLETGRRLAFLEQRT